MTLIKRYEPNCKTGLTKEQLDERISNGLVNFDNQPKTKTVKQIILSNLFTYFNFLNTVLGAAIIFAGILQGQFLYSLKNCLFMGVIICNTIISTIQEIISKKIIDKLSFLASSKVKVIRDSKEEEITIEEIVLDDVVRLEIGNQVVTDSIVLTGEVEVNEAFLTGEVEPIVKKKGDMILSGSFIVSGECYARVEHIGGENYISSISQEAKYNKKVNSIIMNSFERLLKVLSILIIPIGILFLINQYSITNNIYESIFATVAALIGMIPEGLVLLTSSVMAVSVIRLSKYKVLVQQLYCIEVLARVNVLCLDKTGTITEGKMQVQDVIIQKGHNKSEVNEILSEICEVSNDHSSTFQAIVEKFGKSNKWTFDNNIPFSSNRKFSAVSFLEHGSYYLGAPEFILNKEQYSEIKNEVSNYQENYRVLLLAHNNEKLVEKPEKLELIAFVLIKDVVRKNAKATLEYFDKQGVAIKIISGDHYKTVSSIAKEAGVKDVVGVDASTLKDEELDDAVLKYNVFGRVTPIQKKKIVSALKRQGYTVAMTGDGVNDVLALKEADCSIAMASGSDASRNVSQLVLLNSDFSSMPHVVAEGRRTINNIERSASLLLVKTIFTMLLVLICIFLSSKYFFVPIQLTLITMFTIGIPSFVLALEPNTEIVKGNFLIKVIGKSVPAALTVVFNVILVMLFKYVFGLSEDVVTSLVVFLTGMTGFIFLYRLCQPFNWFRLILWLLLLDGFVYCAFFQYDFFNIKAINFEIALIFGVLLICSLYVFGKLNKLTVFILDKIDAKKNKSKKL
mgnify:FL=1